MSVRYTLAKLIGGEGLADKSERRRLQKKYEHAEKELKTKTSVIFEQFPSNPDIPTATTYLTSTQPWHPDTGTSLKRDFSHDHLIPTPPITPVWKPPTGMPDISARDPPDRSGKPRNPLMPPVVEMRGFGKHRISIEADKHFQMEHLHNTISDLGPRFIKGTLHPDFVGVDRDVYDEFLEKQAQKHEFAKARYARVPRLLCRIDPVTGKRLQREFISPYIIPAPAIALDYPGLHQSNPKRLAIATSELEELSKAEDTAGTLEPVVPISPITIDDPVPEEPALRVSTDLPNELPTVTEAENPVTSQRNVESPEVSDASPPQDLLVSQEADSETESVQSDDTIRPSAHRRSLLQSAIGEEREPAT